MNASKMFSGIRSGATTFLAVIAVVATGCVSESSAVSLAQSEDVDGVESSLNAADESHAGHMQYAERGVPTGADSRRANADAYSLDELTSTFRDVRDSAVMLRDLSGKVRVITMVYTHCTATCPLIMSDLKRIEAAIPEEDRDRVGFVVVTLDPVRDTPQRLETWGKGSLLDFSRWTLLTGEDGDIRELAASLGVRYQPHESGEVAHSNVISVLDEHGVIRHRQRGLGAGHLETIASIEQLLR